MSTHYPPQPGDPSTPGPYESGAQNAADPHEPGAQSAPGPYESGAQSAYDRYESGTESVPGSYESSAQSPPSGYATGEQGAPGGTTGWAGSTPGGEPTPSSSPAPADQPWPWTDPASGTAQHYQPYDYAMGRAVEPQPSQAYPEDGGAYPPAATGDPNAVGGHPQGARRPQGRASWVALVGAAVLAAGLASGGTAALLSLNDDGPAAADQASDDSSPQSIPVVAAADGTPDWEAVAEAVRPAVVAIDVAGQGGSGAGSGVVWDADGHIVTNNHVVAGAQQIVVTLADGRMFEAEIVGADPITDLAVLALSDPPSDLDLPVIGDAQDQQVGRPVMAVGNPLGLSSTVTTGIISALDRPVTAGEGQGQAPTVTNAIQIDAAINPGNSGGPLFDAEGRVIGITSAIASLSGGQSGNIGLGFAIPVDLVNTITEQLIETGTAEHAFLGVALSEDTVTADGVTRSGASVQSIEPGSPADEAGLAEGDVITAIDDRPVSSAAALTGYVRAHTAGEKVMLAVVRDGELTDVEVTLATTAEQTS